MKSSHLHLHQKDESMHIALCGTELYINNVDTRSKNNYKICPSFTSRGNKC